MQSFNDKILPEKGVTLVGYSALIKNYDLKVPLPETLSLLSSKHRRYVKKGWSVYTPKYKPTDDLSGHLTFALRHEGVELNILDALFNQLDKSNFEKIIRKEPLSKYSRIIWFLYEFLTEKLLDIEDLKTGNFIDLLNSKKYYVAKAIPSRRHRVRNNLTGVRDFCPLVKQTPKLNNYIAKNLRKIAHEQSGGIHKDVLLRASAFLLLKDSKASFAIEGEEPSLDRAQRWGKAIGQAGYNDISVEELLRLQKIVIGDNRFIPLGIRTAGGFIGLHDRLSATPIPDHISAKWQDLPRLINGLLETIKLLEDSNIDPVIAATIIAFGFLFIHPFSDGNGRLHRYIIHHILSKYNFTPPGIIFPVSSSILMHIEEYRKVLEAYSKPRLEFIEWKTTADNNINVINETINLYRYFDATRQAEFLYDCVAETVEKILPEEINYLKAYDKMKIKINELFEMPNPMIDLLIRFLEQNNGKLSKRAQHKEFKLLTEKECAEIESLYEGFFINSSLK